MKARVVRTVAVLSAAMMMFGLPAGWCAVEPVVADPRPDTLGADVVETLADRLERLGLEDWLEELDESTLQELCDRLTDLMESPLGRSDTAQALSPAPRETWHDRLTRGHYTVRLKGSACLQEKAGYRQASDSVQEASTGYLGSPLALSATCQYRYGDRLRWGFSVEKDAGEKGLDGVSGFFSLRDAGRLKSLVAGDYRVSAGLGLVTGSASFGGRLSAADAWQRSNDITFRPHVSTAESGFFRGLGAELTDPSKRWRAAAFVSYRAVDTRRTDSVFTSFKTDGLHRTLSESAQRRNTKEFLAGGRFGYRGGSLHLSLNGLYYRYDAVCQPAEKPYNLYAFRGEAGWNLSLDGRWRKGNFLLSGEAALADNGAAAALLRLNARLHPKVDLACSARAYHPRYHAPYGEAFSVNSAPANETGLFVLLTARPGGGWTLGGYLDVYAFPWLKYRVNAPSEGYEGMVQADWMPGRSFEWLIRYKVRQSRANATAGEETGLPGLSLTVKRDVKSQWMYTSGPWRLKTVLCAEFLRTGTAAVTTGFALAQDVRWRREDFPLQVAVQGALFDTDSYADRISLYGPELSGSMPFSSLYGRGVRAVCSVGWHVSRCIRWDVLLRHTFYTDCTSIGTGLETIDGPRRTTLSTLLKIKF